jgi:hypothetical protein
MERAGYYFQNWDNLNENNWKKKMTGVIERLEAVKFTDLPEMEDLSVIKEGVGRGSGYELLHKWDELIDLGSSCWHTTFEFPQSLLRGTGPRFFQTADQIFPGNPHRDHGLRCPLASTRSSSSPTPS